MEFDIINEIMTDSIAGLFQPKVAVQNFFPSEQPKSGSFQQKPQPVNTSTSPKTSKTETKKIFGGTNKQEQETVVHKSLDSFQNLQKLEPPTFSQRSVSATEKESAPVVARKNKEIPEQPKEPSQPIQAKNTQYTLENWTTRDGPQKLNESLARLNLNIHNIGKVSLSGLSTKQLETEKKSVKQELKRYDAAFMDLFKRMPSREEKEPMRPLYIYYKRVKQCLDRAEGEEKNTRNEVGGGGSKNQSLGNVSVDSEKGIRSSVNTSRDNATKGRENKSAINSAPSSGRKMDSSFEEQLSLDNFPGKGKPAEKQEVPKKQELRLSREEAQKRIEILNAVKTQLREKLHAYQLDFTKNNNRKIKYHKDIIPVEEEYKRYKEVKDEIQSLEELLK